MSNKIEDDMNNFTMCIICDGYLREAYTIDVCGHSCNIYNISL